ncbi:hypothetical protein [Prevotella corporis]|uniref:hypothetical protein n=1 Tax=Prevotella corporis TaxID=28128 RepID=UPI00236634FA|nr:hypothetical protein [Prevotella corporis]
MKKGLSLAFLLMLSVAIYAQKQITKFMGIPVDGSKTAMIQKLKNKGFVYNAERDWLEGESNGEEVLVYPVMNNNKVYRIAVLEINGRDEAQIRIRFNTLLNQFKNNKKYVQLSGRELTEEDDISYDLSINNKQIAATFAKLPQDNDLGKRTVWFSISYLNGSYRIWIFYDNGFNRDYGEDL